MRMPSSAHLKLLRGIRGAIATDSWFDRWLSDPTAAGPSLVIEEFDSTPWASLTYAGMRHGLEFRLSGTIAEVETAYDRLRMLMAEPEFDIAGHFLAEIALADANAVILPDDGMEMRMRYEVLTIEE